MTGGKVEDILQDHVSLDYRLTTFVTDEENTFSLCPGEWQRRSEKPWEKLSK